MNPDYCRDGAAPDGADGADGHMIRARRDSLPEGKAYQDDGCEVALHCVSCPLPSCIHEEFRGLSRLHKRERDAEIIAQSSSMSVNDIAAHFKVSRKTVYRAGPTSWKDI